MQEKIKWYQEVLELEPGSKVFFPLARLLVQTGQIDAALQTLQQGLVRHPEFIEARLYLIDVLFTHQRTAQCDEQVSVLTDLFASYTGFWQAWGAYLSQKEQGKETSLALTFLAASFQNPHLRLSDIFTQGLQSLHAGKLPASPAPCVASAATTAATEAQGAENTSFASHIADKNRLAEPETSLSPSVVSPAPIRITGTVNIPTALATNAPTAVAPVEVKAPLTVPPLAELVQSLPSPRETGALNESSANESLSDADDPDDADDSEDGEERFSLRTRSMAEVLAEQGDFKNALDIYQELTAQAVTPEEQLDLQHRISTLTARMGSVQGQTAESPALPDTAPGKHRLLSLLETLAVRFEAHAQG